MTDQELIEGVAVCKCGCGQVLVPSRRGREKIYICGHNSKKQNNYRWNGGSSLPRTKVIGHPNADQNGWVPDHILIAEKVLGNRLPSGSVVHHVDGNNHNNELNNLVICQDQGYHQVLHRRARAYHMCGNANHRKCKFCKEHDDPQNMAKRGKGYIHRKCEAEYKRKNYVKSCQDRF